MNQHPRKASPQVQGGRTVDRVSPGVRLSVRNLSDQDATGELHFLTVDQPLQSGMEKRKKAAKEAAAIAVPCVLRISRNQNKPTIELEIEDEAALKLAAELLRMTAR